MSLKELLLGKPIPNDEAEEEKIGPLAGIPVLGLDALASAAYGPEAALTVLLVLGSGASRYIGPLIVVIGVLLLIVQFSYRQTIATYPDGGGSYSVARANLGMKPALLAAAFAHSGRRLVYSTGIVILSLLAAALLVAFAPLVSLLPAQPHGHRPEDDAPVQGRAAGRGHQRAVVPARGDLSSGPLARLA